MTEEESVVTPEALSLAPFVVTAAAVEKSDSDRLTAIIARIAVATNTGRSTGRIVPQKMVSSDRH